MSGYVHNYVAPKDPKNFIWPVSVAFNNSSMNNLLEYAVFSDGIYCRQNVFADKFITFKVEEIKDLPKGKEELHPLADLKIPFKLYEDTIKFFRQVIKEKGKMEAYVLYARKPDGKYFIYVPKQTVGGANVTYTLEDFHTDHPDCYIVADQHSHVEFGAFWSGTDDADDKRNRYSVVSGMHQKFYPEVKVRFSYGKKRIDLTLDDLFADNDNYDEALNLVPAVAILQLDNHVVSYVVGGVSNGYSNLPYKKNPQYSNYYSNFGYGGYDDGGYGDYEDLSGYDKQNADMGIYSSDRQAVAQEQAKAGIVIKCDKCGKFTNMMRAKKIRGEFLCNDCISEQQDLELERGYGHNPNSHQGKMVKPAESIGGALLAYISKSKDEVKNMSSLKKLSDFLEELKG
jgi:ssDNA-binding Zn-finger/Zn-ribbon topoisomerase 1